MTRVRARWLVPIASPPISNGRLVIDEGRIVEIGPALSGHRVDLDLGDSVVLPGLVNAHTHLELTLCQGRTPFAGSFVDWIERVTACHPQGVEAEETLSNSITSGLRQSIATGVTTIADLGYGQRAVDAWGQAEANIAGFLEVLGMGPKCHSDHPLAVDRMIELCRTGDNRDNAGRATPIRGVSLSPHAPYSTDRSVYARAIDFVRQTGKRICTHLAETREELRFLQDGTGPFRELLERRGLWDGSFTPPGCSPIQYALQIGLMHTNTLLVHVNYVTDTDLDLLAGGNASIAYCPRSHQFFDHEPHRWREMLARGVNVCLGTDSLASNHSLSILDEMRHLHETEPDVPPEIVLEMATLAGARALGLDSQVGSLEAGKQADLLVIPLENAATATPLNDIIGSQERPGQVFVAGSPIPIDGGSVDRPRNATL